MKRWSSAQMSSQEGKTVIVTGANSGLGFYTSRAMALGGARVIMACRNMEKAEAARDLILDEKPDVEPEIRKLDMASLDSVREFAGAFLRDMDGPDLLVNNAGLMAIPYHKTREGFEMQFGVNHLGHFALTALLWPGLSKGRASRIVSVSSLAHKFGKIRFEDIHWEKQYSRWGAYGMSKLANLLFIRELSKRFAAKKSGIMAVAAHPGYADTALQAKSMRMAGSHRKAELFQLVNRLVAQSGEMGALPVLYAATAPGVKQGGYYGPDGPLRLRGYPVQEKLAGGRVNDLLAGQLWKLSEDLTGIRFSP